MGEEIMIVEDNQSQNNTNTAIATNNQEMDYLLSMSNRIPANIEITNPVRYDHEVLKNLSNDVNDAKTNYIDTCKKLGLKNDGSIYDIDTLIKYGFNANEVYEYERALDNYYRINNNLTSFYGFAKNDEEKEALNFILQAENNSKKLNPENSYYKKVVEEYNNAFVEAFDNYIYIVPKQKNKIIYGRNMGYYYGGTNETQQQYNNRVVEKLKKELPIGGSGVDRQGNRYVRIHKGHIKHILNLLNSNENFDFYVGNHNYKNIDWTNANDYFDKIKDYYTDAKEIVHDIESRFPKHLTATGIMLDGESFGLGELHRQFESGQINTTTYNAQRKYQENALKAALTSDKSNKKIYTIKDKDNNVLSLLDNGTDNKELLNFDDRVLNDNYITKSGYVPGLGSGLWVVTYDKKDDKTDESTKKTYFFSNFYDDELRREFDNSYEISAQNDLFIGDATRQTISLITKDNTYWGIDCHGNDSYNLRIDNIVLDKMNKAQASSVHKALSEYGDIMRLLKYKQVGSAGYVDRIKQKLKEIVDILPIEAANKIKSNIARYSINL